MKRSVRPQARESRYIGFGVNPLVVHSDDDLGWKVKPEHGKVAEIDKALEEEEAFVEHY